MSLFDFFFPEEAQAAHLRRLADATTASNMRARVNAVRMDASRESNQKRIEELEDEVSQLTIVVEALLEKSWLQKLLRLIYATALRTVK